MNPLTTIKKSFLVILTASFFIPKPLFAAINIVVSSDQSGNINLGTDSESTLDLNAGTLTGNVTMGDAGQITTFAGGAVNGTITGPGKVIINSESPTTLVGNIGTDGSPLSQVIINANRTLNTSDRNVKSDIVLINDGAILNYGSGDLVSDVSGASSGVGSFVFNNTKTTKFTIGQNNKLANIDIANGVTITTDVGKNISANIINLNSGSTLNINVASTVDAIINGSNDINEKIKFSGSGSYNWSSIIGNGNPIDEVDVLNGVSLVNNGNINANSILVGEGGSGVLTQSSGSLGFDDNSLIKIKNNAVFNYNGGTINGKVRGSSYGNGTFNINYNYTNIFKIGYDYYLANVNVASGVILTAGADISASNTTIAGTLNLGDTARIVTGNLSTSDSGATIDLGSAHHSITGSFSMISGNDLKILALNNSSVGTINVGGVANIADNINLKITFDPNNGYISDGASYAIIAGAEGSNINKINEDKIDINGTGSNQYGLLTFTTQTSGNNLLLDVSRVSVATITSNQLAQNIYNNIDAIGSNASGNLREFQKYIDDNSTTNSQRESALESLAPQVDNAVHQVVFNNVKTSLEISKSRLEKLRDQLSLGDIFESYGIWMQAFNAKLVQDSIGNFNGYNSTSKGLVLGADQLVEENLRLGVSASYTTANANSRSDFYQETTIKSYQFNLYGGYNFDDYFINSAIGMAVNQYSSQRAIPLMAVEAHANYNGETYIAKIEGGKSQKLVNGFELTPKIGLIMARNQIGTYFENGAGTLDLTVSNEKADLLESEISLDLSYHDLNFSDVKIIPKINFSSIYDFIGDNQTTSSNFTNQNVKFETSARDIDQLGFKLGFGVEIYQSSDVVLTANYTKEQKFHYQSNVGNVNLRYDFW